jgi:primosomal protein N'
MRFISKKDLTGELSDIQKRNIKEVKILGPSSLRNKQGKYEFKLLMKSSVRGALHSVARSFMGAFKDSKDIKIKVDVDPISI